MMANDREGVARPQSSVHILPPHICASASRGPGAGKRLLVGSQPLAGLDPPPRGWGGVRLKQGLGHDASTKLSLGDPNDCTTHPTRPSYGHPLPLPYGHQSWVLGRRRLVLEVAPYYYISNLHFIPGELLSKPLFKYIIYSGGENCAGHCLARRLPLVAKRTPTCQSLS